MDFEKKYEEEIRSQKLSDEFIYDLSARMAKKRMEALEAENTENNYTENVEIIRHSNRRLYISRLATVASVAAVAGIIIGVSGIYSFEKGTVNDEDISVTDNYDSFINAHAETSCIQISGTSAVSTYNEKLPYAVTSGGSVSVNLTSAAAVTEVPVSETVPEVQNGAVTRTKISAAEKTANTVPAVNTSVYPEVHTVPVTAAVSSSVTTTSVSKTASASVTTCITTSAVTESRKPDVTDLTEAVTDVPEVTDMTGAVTDIPEVSDTPVTTESVQEPIAGAPVILSSESMEAAPGDELEVKIRIDSETTTMSGFVLYTDYSNEAFDITKVDITGINKNENDFRIKNEENRLIVFCFNNDIENQQFNKEEFITVKIKVKDDASPGEYYIHSRDSVGDYSLANYINDEKKVVSARINYSGFELKVTEKEEK